MVQTLVGQRFRQYVPRVVTVIVKLRSFENSCDTSSLKLSIKYIFLWPTTAVVFVLAYLHGENKNVDTIHDGKKMNFCDALRQRRCIPDHNTLFPEQSNKPRKKQDGHNKNSPTCDAPNTGEKFGWTWVERVKLVRKTVVAAANSSYKVVAVQMARSIKKCCGSCVQPRYTHRYLGW